MHNYNEDTSPHRKENYIQDIDCENVYSDYNEELDFTGLNLDGIDTEQLTQMLSSLMDNPDVMNQINMMKNLSGPIQFINMLQGPLQILNQLSGSLNMLNGFGGLGNIAGLLNGIGNNTPNNNQQLYRGNYNRGYNNYPYQNQNRNQYRYNQYPNRQYYNNRYQNRRYPVASNNLLGNLIGGVPNILLRLFGNR